MNNTLLPIIEQYHRDVDSALNPLNWEHENQLKCGDGCSDCCQDELTVFKVEAVVIKAHYGDLLTSGTPHPVGKCAFLNDAGSCRIYEHRPYVCRSQGLPLRWIDEDEAGELGEYRDICPKNDSPDFLETLEVESCWTLGPAEEALQQVQVENQKPGTEPERLMLRDLFTQK
ncbi:MAG: YkgJ family cysteine cluster protein [Deltaproteobacteria bacterium]|nr:YkgJ family cysteine cluster protein [Deltaproteobacteria bacterium]MBT6434975.1 YkgJ family cysteine cluster protein [Deltaproteobacteria bacterium]MBT6489112.1 YkgJ family cysteine cluster protein [Deltaproteobacteria bacterium]